MTTGVYLHIATEAETPAGVSVDEVLIYQGGTVSQARGTLAHYLKRYRRLHTARRMGVAGQHAKNRYFVHKDHAQAWMAADPWAQLVPVYGGVQLILGKQRTKVLPKAVLARLGVHFIAAAARP